MANGGMGNLKGVAEVRANERGVVQVYHSVVAGSTGAITSESSGTGVDFAAGSSGIYVVTMDHPYCSLLGVQMTPVGASSGQFLEVSTAWSQSAKTLSLRVLNDAASAENLIDGQTYLFTFTFRNTTV